MISQLVASHNLIKEFASRGFVIFSDSVMGQETLAALRLELDRVLRGECGGPYDSHALPTKVTCIPYSPSPSSSRHVTAVAGACPVASRVHDARGSPTPIRQDPSNDKHTQSQLAVQKACNLPQHW
jgi:hypothetical protein